MKVKKKVFLLEYDPDQTTSTSCQLVFKRSNKVPVPLTIDNNEFLENLVFLENNKEKIRYDKESLDFVDEIGNKINFMENVQTCISEKK